MAGAAVAGGAGTGPGSVETAAGSGPETARPAGWGLECAGGLLRELESGGVEPRTVGICENAWPNCVVASVDECERSA